MVPGRNLRTINNRTMHASLIAFAGHLRDNGIKVSQAELTDASHALTRVALDVRSIFKDTLRATLIKRVRDIPVFDDLFDLHFSAGRVPGSAATDHEESSLQALRSSIEELRNRGEVTLSPITEMLLTGRYGALMRLVADRVQSLGIDRMAIAPLRGRFFLNRVRRELNVDGMRAEIEAVLADAQGSGAGLGQVQAINDYVERSFARLEDVLASLVQREIQKSRFQALRRIEDQDITERDLFQLSESEIQAMRPAVDRLAKTLKDRLSMRLRHANRGRFDLKTTLRKNIGYGGPLPDLRFKNKKPSRPQVVALCDVSRSVSNFSRFMLLFLYTLKEVIAKVRSFTFVGDLTEVTGLFQEYDVNEAVSLAAEGCGLRYPVGTDYGASLAQFTDEHLMAVNSKTTVIILGDARTNRLPPRAEALEAIAERARKVIWLNPESSATWALGDSVMRIYRPLCTSVAECGNLAQLTRVIEDLFGGRA